MSQDNYITLRGYLTAEPKYWETAQTRTPVAEIRLGSTPRRLDRSTGEWQDGDPSYYTVKCWRRLAVNVAGSLRKGDMVLVRGKVITRRWLDDQQRPRMQMQVEADSVGHDLAFGWSRFNRGIQGPWNAAQRLADGELARAEMGPGDYEPPGADGADGGDGTDGADSDDTWDEQSVTAPPSDGLDGAETAEEDEAPAPTEMEVPF